MHIKFLKHGIGAPEKAASYLISEIDHLGDKRAGVETLRGDAQTFVAIAGSLTFKHRYTSGVIAWSKEDAPTDEQINETLDAFEKHAFAGLDPTRYHMNAVLHVSADGSKHVHVLVPRVDLLTGKSLNIAPPGHTDYFDKLRDCLNEKHCWSKPDDLAILNAAAALPNHVHAQRAAASQVSFQGKTRDEKRALLHEIVRQRVDGGFIAERKDVISTLAEFGIITRQGKDTVSVKLNGDNKAIKMPGEFYKDGFNFITYQENRARAEANCRASKSHAVDTERCDKLLGQLQSATAARARFNAEKYAVTAHGVERSDGARLPDATHNLTGADPIGRPALSGVSKAVVNGAGPGQTGTENQSGLSGTKETAAGNDSLLSKPAETAAEQTANQSGLVSIMRSLGGSNNPDFIGEINERIAAVNESTSGFFAEAKRSTADLHQRARDLYRATEEEKRFLGRAESSTGGSTRFKHFIGFYQAIRNAIAGAFARQIDRCVKGLRRNWPGAGQDQHGNQTAPRQDTDYTISIDPNPFRNFFTGYQRKRKLRRERNERPNFEVRAVNWQLGEIVKRSDGLLNVVSQPTFAIKPKSPAEIAKFFDHLHTPAALDIQKYARYQESMFHQKQSDELFEMISKKYSALQQLEQQEKITDQMHEAVQEMVKNDVRMIAYAEKRQGIHFSQGQKYELKVIFEDAKHAFRLEKMQSEVTAAQTIVEHRPTIPKPDYDSPSPF